MAWKEEPQLVCLKKQPVTYYFDLAEQCEEMFVNIEQSWGKDTRFVRWRSQAEMHVFIKIYIYI